MAPKYLRLSASAYFDELPSADRIDEVAQVYVDALQRAKWVDTVATTPESFVLGPVNTISG
jgi:hypothetical protein